MNEEIVAKFGADTSGIDRGIRSINEQIKGLKEKTTEQFREVGREIFKAFSVASLIGAIENSFHRAQAITRQAESLGVGTDFIQDIQNIGKASGIASENIEKMLNKFIGTLKPGQDVEKEFYNLADRIASIEDPVSRAALAIDTLGEKLGPKMIAILSKGSAGIKELASGWSKFNQQEIKDLEQAHIQIEKTSNALQVYTGKLINLIAIGARYAGARSSGMSPDQAMKHIVGMATGETGEGNNSAARQAAEITGGMLAERRYREYVQSLALKSKSTSFSDKFSELNKRLVEANEDASNTNSVQVHYERMKAVADIEAQITNLKKQQTDEEKKINDELDKRERALDKSQRKLSREEADSTKWGLGELADLAHPSGWHSGIDGSFQTFSGPPLARAARFAQNELSAAHMSEAWGNSEQARIHRQNYLNMVKNNPALKSSEQDPFRAATEEVAENTRKLAEAATGQGIKVQTED